MPRRRTLLRGLLVVAAAVVLLMAAAYAYLVITSRDAPAPASLGPAPTSGDLGSTTVREVPVNATGTSPGSSNPPADTAVGTPPPPAGAWSVAPGPGNFVGYRVRERLGPVAAPSDAVGRTGQVAGTLRINGTELTAMDISVDVATLDSGSSRRDDFVRDDALDAAGFPNGELHLDAPVDLGPPVIGQVIEVSVPANLTLRGVTNRVTFAVEARWNGPTIQAAGTTRIRRRDFGIDVSSRAGFNIDEEGTIEFELIFSPDGAAVDASSPTLLESVVAPTDEGEFRPPCRSEETLLFDVPVLVTTASSGSAAVALVTGSGEPASLHTTAGLTGGASWSPDGTEVIFSSGESPSAPRTLFIASVDSPTPTPVPGLSNVTQPAWGPDGTIVFVQWTGEDSELWITDRAGVTPRLLVHTPGIDSDPRWAPDGRTIVFTTSASTTNQDVLTVDVNGGELTTVAGGRGYEYAPSFTPDGQRVLFARDGSLFSVDVGGSDERQLTSGASDTNPEISPDGRQLAMIRDGSLHIASPDGSDPRCVQTGAAITGGPRWQP